MEVNDGYRTKVNSNESAISILTACAFIMIDTIEHLIGIANSLELIIVL